MKYIDIMNEKGITFKDLIEIRSPIMYETSYALVKKYLTTAEQCKIIRNADYDYRDYEFIRRLVAYVNENDSNRIADDVITTFLYNCDSWQNYIHDFQQLIRFADNPVAVLSSIIDRYEENENMVHNIAFNLATNFNMFLTYFNLELLEASARNNFFGVESDEIEFLLSENNSKHEENTKIFAENSYRLIKNLVAKQLEKNIKTFMVYSIPAEIFKFLSQHEMITLFDIVNDSDYTNKVDYSNHLLTRMSRAITKENAKDIAIKYNLDVPQQLREDGAVEADELNIVLDLENPYKHFKTNEYAMIYNTQAGEQIAEAALKIENIVKDVNNIYTIRGIHKNSHGQLLTDEWIIELFEKHVDYVTKVFESQRAQSNDFMLDLFVRFMKLSSDKLDAFNRFWTLPVTMNSKMLAVANILNDEPIWLSYVMQRNSVVGKAILTRVIVNDHELQADLLGE